MFWVLDQAYKTYMYIIDFKIKLEIPLAKWNVSVSLGRVTDGYEIRNALQLRNSVRNVDNV